MIRLSKDGTVSEYKSYKEALVATGLFTTPANAQTAINKLTRAGYTLLGEDTAPAPAPAPAPTPAPEPKVITIKRTEPAPTPKPAPVMQVVNTPAIDQRKQTNLALAIQDLLKDALPQQNPQTAQVNAEEVREIIRQELQKLPTTTLTVKVAELPAVELSKQHHTFEDLLIHAANRVHVMLIGPAGSGKTTGAEKAAEALNLPFYAVSVGMQTSKSDLLGYMDATGKYVRTPLREAYEKGGIYLIDEIDAGNPNVLTVLNAALANGICAFPDGMIRKHADFICIAAANTFGTGANRQYVGRNQLDAASLDRFSRLAWEYDEILEAKLCSNPVWCKQVQQYRRRANEKALRVVISPRASINGAKLLAAGMPQRKVEEVLIFAGLDETTINQIRG